MITDTRLHEAIVRALTVYPYIPEIAIRLYRSLGRQRAVKALHEEYGTFKLRHRGEEVACNREGITYRGTKVSWDQVLELIVQSTSPCLRDYPHVSTGV